MTSIWVATLLTAATLAAAPADFAGNWKVKYAGPPMTGPKTIGSMILALNVDDDRVTGMVQLGAWPGVAPVTDGKIDGDKISFTARGYLTSTTGIPTCKIEGVLSKGELVVRLTSIHNGGGPVGRGEWEYRGGQVDEVEARKALTSALTFLSQARRHSPCPAQMRPDACYPEDYEPEPLTVERLAIHPTLDAGKEGEARKLSGMVEQWEKVRAPSFAEGLSTAELDRLVGFYNSPLGQSLVAAPHGEAEIRTLAAQYVAAR